MGIKLYPGPWTLVVRENRPRLSEQSSRPWKIKVSWAQRQPRGSQSQSQSTLRDPGQPERDPRPGALCEHRGRSPTAIWDDCGLWREPFVRCPPWAVWAGRMETETFGRAGCMSRSCWGLKLRSRRARGVKRPQRSGGRGGREPPTPTGRAVEAIVQSQATSPLATPFSVGRSRARRGHWRAERRGLSASASAVCDAQAQAQAAQLRRRPDKTRHTGRSSVERPTTSVGRAGTVEQPIHPDEQRSGAD